MRSKQMRMHVKEAEKKKKTPNYQKHTKNFSSGQTDDLVRSLN